MRDVDQTKERLKDPANRVHKIKNNLRRILNWCKNKGIDPIHSNNPDICSAKSAIESIGLNWTELVGTWEASERNWEIFKQKYQWQCIN